MEITKTYCDLCGSEIHEGWSALQVAAEWSEPRYAPGGPGHFVTGSRDLCPMCAAELAAWMKGRMPPSEPIDPGPDPAA